MPDNHPAFNYKNIRELLIQGFDQQELSVFCFDEHAFQPFCDELPKNAGKSEIVHRLIEYAKKKVLMESLLESVA